MKGIIFITGGARSGKSSFALKTAKKLGEDIYFLATCIPKDRELKKRVALHKNDRPKHWKTIEEGADLQKAIARIDPHCNGAILDCITFYISNLMFSGHKEQKIKTELSKLINRLSDLKFPVIVVSNEVGSGVVPPTKSGRIFRDLVGFANQLLAGKSKKAYLMASGIPLVLKQS